MIDELDKLLNDPKWGADAMKVLDFCAEPRSPMDLMTKCRTKRDVFDVLVKLKNIGEIVFADGKYARKLVK